MDDFRTDSQEFFVSVGETDLHAPENPPLPPEYTLTDEFPDRSILLPSDGADRGGQKRRKRFRSKLLLQSAAILVTVLLVTSSFNADVLGSDSVFSLEQLNTALLDLQLRQSGAATGIITVSMLWQTPDDMDLHIITPSGEEIFYGNPQIAGGLLDVDMQISDIVPNPVENIFFSEPEHGTYRVYVQNFCDRTPDTDTPVLVRVKISGRTREYPVTVDASREICEFEY